MEIGLAGNDSLFWDPNQKPSPEKQWRTVLFSIEQTQLLHKLDNVVSKSPMVSEPLDLATVS